MYSSFYRARPGFYKAYLMGKITALRAVRGYNRQQFHATLNYIMFMQTGIDVDKRHTWQEYNGLSLVAQRIVSAKL